MFYHSLGILSSVVFLLTWYGLTRQLIKIYQRRQSNLTGTDGLSLNQFGSSFFAFYASFIVGIASADFNHYLVWTRTGALLLTLCVLYCLWQDRPSLRISTVLFGSTACFVAGFVAMAFRPLPTYIIHNTDIIVVVITLVLLQGTIGQIRMLYRNQEVGALSFSLLHSILLKDVTTLAFLFTLPIATAWPLILLNGSSIVSRGILLLLMRRKQRLTDNPSMMH